MPRPETLAEAWELLARQAQAIARLEAERTAWGAERQTMQATAEAQGLAIATLQAQLEKLTAQGKQNSTNSSRPPSSDGPKTPARPNRPPRSRQRGAQPGHRPHLRTLLPPEQVDLVVEHWPAQCPSCETPLAAESRAEVAAPVRHQVTEVPPVRPIVTEHRLHRVRCAQCGRATRAPLPPEVPKGAFGSHLQAIVALLSGRYRLSRREVVELSEDLLGVALAVGSVDKLCQATAQGLAKPVAELKQALPIAEAVHSDETGWRQAGKGWWLWVVVTPFGTFFEVAASRGSAVIKGLLGADFAGYLISDRCTAYTWVPAERRQVCWAHLKRDFQGLVDWGGAATPVGQRALRLTKRLFDAWHARRDDPDAPHVQGTNRRLRRIQAVFRRLFETEQTNPTQAGTLSRSLLKLWPALWTFLTVEGVEPTNNAAERAIRPAVLWRKGSFGTQSDAGARFVERLLTVTATLRQQERNLLDFLTEVCNANLSGQPPPSLLARSP